MQLTGYSFIAGQWQGHPEAGQFYAFEPKHNRFLNQAYCNATAAQLTYAIDAAQQAFLTYRKATSAQRATFLNTIADEIMALGDALLDITHQETNLPLARLQGERGRTVTQLRAFATALNAGQATLIDAAEPTREPLPKPRLELAKLPVGVVAVFGASNFPYAFSTLGGDTASALAAGCPVVVKSHTAHPGTSELMTRAIATAISKCGMPNGTFSMIQAKDYAISHQLVAHPFIKAVGFTGSLNVAQKLMATIQTRREVIPFYGELGSINPQFVLPELAATEGNTLAAALVQSMLMGNGQFCTSPGVWLIPETACELLNQAQALVLKSQSDTLLTPAITASYQQAITARAQMPGVQLFARGELLAPYHGEAVLFKTTLANYLAIPALHEEVFGPQAVIVTYRDIAELAQFIAVLEGQLTASMHGSHADLIQFSALAEQLQYQVGRLITNQMPTGVEVSPAMNHGGPYPSSSDVRCSSVGLTAMQRFQRPICYQGA
ncbi:aldehyde dehydrogenase (NADP(+)) [Pseudoalteromonas fenneropenaei]|uniref:Aldehyde dehydrogenase (NADP(+)) n=1 Tax=Pseudoalteromonas fenneropenaei TaxID=1737459 RepID=A0ABV7CFN0_9GAMM